MWDIKRDSHIKGTPSRMRGRGESICKAIFYVTENDVDNGHIFGHTPNEKPADKAGMQISCLLHALPLAASISSYRFRTTYLNDCSIYGEVPLRYRSELIAHSTTISRCNRSAVNPFCQFSSRFCNHENYSITQVLIPEC